jgi:hypothetical protein
LFEHRHFLDKHFYDNLTAMGYIVDEKPLVSSFMDKEHHIIAVKSINLNKSVESKDSISISNNYPFID